MSIPDLHEALPSAPPEAPRGFWRNVLQILFFLVVIRPFMALFIGLRVRGREYLPDPTRAPFVLIANHASHLDTISLLSLFPLTALRRVRPVAAADYFTRTPLMAWLSRTFINILPIERRKEDRTHDPLEVIRAALDRGESLILFPEGTRAIAAEMGPFKAGIAIIATDRPKIPIVPAWLGNMGRSLPKGEFIPVPFFCEVRLGSPRHPTGPRQQILTELESAVRELGAATRKAIMKDMTKGPVGAHILELSAFIALSTMFQTLYFLADLYFVGRLGKEALAGVGLGGNLMMLVLALTQSLGVGATSLIAQSMGQKDRDRAGLVFNQSLVLSTLTGLTFGVVMFVLRGAYCRGLAADATTAGLGAQYLDWFVPALALQFPLVAMGAALRGLGDMKVPTAIQVTTVLLNIALAPVLMFGWGTGHSFGVAGAGLASFIAVAFGSVAFTAYFRRQAAPLRFHLSLWTPRHRLWWEMLRIGLPAGGEFALIAVYMVLVYGIIRPFGAAAQAGFGIGVRLMQSLFLPAIAIAFATAPVAGQNFGARLGARVRESFYAAARMSALVMVILTVLCHIAPEALIRIFNGDPEVVRIGGEYLRILSWNFLASGVVFVASSVFQGMGNTLPALASSGLRLVLFALPAAFLCRQPGFQLRHVWYLSVASVLAQFCASMWLLHREFGRKLSWPALPSSAAPSLEAQVPAS